MKQFLSVLCAIIMVLSLSVFEVEAVGNSTVEMDPFPVYSGVYVAGDSVDADSYMLTCTETSSVLKVLIFESQENYNTYCSTKRFTRGEERAAVEQNALVDFGIQEGETYYIGLKEGNVLMLDNGEGSLEKISLKEASLEKDASWLDENDSPICSGVFFVGEDIVQAQYKLECTETDWYMEAIVFKSTEEYLNYHSTSRSTNGEESDAIEQYSWSHTDVYKDESCFVDLKEGYVLMVKNGQGRLEMINNENAGDTGLSRSEMLFPVYSGLYFAGEDIEEGSYVLTCLEADWSVKVVVFETKDDYLNYHHTSRFTHGEESAAIEQNALSDFFLQVGKPCFLNLREGMVLLIDDGIGIIESINPGWAVS